MTTSESADPSVIRSIAVHAADVVNAVEARERDRGQTVLRVTPPFSGRMRARIHDASIGEYDSDARDAPIHIDPRILAPDRPPYPTPDRTADELRAADDRTYDRETHHEYHESRIDEWRCAVAESIPETVTIDAGPAEYEVSVIVLGQWPPESSG